MTHPDQMVATTPFEVMADIGAIKSQLDGAVVGFIEFQVEGTVTEAEAPEPTLQEKYELPFNPEKTVAAIGKVGLFATDPDLFMQTEALKQAELNRAA